MKYLFILSIILTSCSTYQKNNNENKNIGKCYLQTVRHFCDPGYELVGIEHTADFGDRETCCRQ